MVQQIKALAVVQQFTGVDRVSYYGVYAGFGFVAYFVVKRLVRETNGRTPEEMSIAIA